MNKSTCALLLSSDPLREAQAIVLLPAAVLPMKLLMSVSPGGSKQQNCRGTKHIMFPLSLTEPELCVFGALMGRLPLWLIMYYDILVTWYLSCRVCAPCIIMPCSRLLYSGPQLLFQAGESLQAVRM